jgi:hypothetical protein
VVEVMTKQLKIVFAQIRRIQGERQELDQGKVKE